jgi:hypothetical protein
VSDYEKWLSGEISDSDLNHRQYGAFQERSRIINLLEKHKQTIKTVSGFLSVCSCGQAIDDYNEHLQELIKGEQK